MRSGYRSMPMKKQDAKKRITNYDEVSLGLTAEEAVREASRCLQCKSPQCVKGCPVGIDIPRFILALTKRNYKKALAVIKEKNSLPAVCGRVCPQEDQCELHCILGKKGSPINIGALERIAADYGDNADSPETSSPKEKKMKVAIIGAGPGGLTCAADLAKKGYAVTVFEALHKPGGVLVYGIPEFRLPKRIVDDEVRYISSLGVLFRYNYVVGKTRTLTQLRDEGYKAFYIGTGAGLPYFLGIEGENLNGVYSANEFLTRVNLMKAYRFPDYDTPVRVGRRVGVIGGGNVAFDSARAARRLGADEVLIIYRRSREEMPAREEEIIHAEEEGIRFMLLTSPLRCTGDDGGFLKGIEVRSNRLGEPDAGGRRRPVPIEGSERHIALDTLVVAIGQGPNPLLLDTIPELECTSRGYITTDEGCRTSIPDVFAGGDIVTGSATVIQAMGAGKKAAESIDNFLRDMDNDAA